MKECLTALSENANLVDEKKKNEVYKTLKQIPFTPWGIDWGQFNSKKNIIELRDLEEICVSRNFYIIWSNELPIIDCDIHTIIKFIDDVTAVEADTWLLSKNNIEIIEFHHEDKITFGMVN